MSAVAAIALLHAREKLPALEEVRHHNRRSPEQKQPNWVVVVVVGSKIFA